MSKENQHRFDPAEVQVFELTMDNPEDQDELNRRLRKPGEPSRCAADQIKSAGNSPNIDAPGESGAEPGKN
jgi:hypothetical protein